MRILHDAVEETLHGLPAQVASALIWKKLAAKGVNLSQRELERLTDQMLKGTSDTFSLHHWKWWEQGQNVTLEFTPEDIDQIEHTFTDFVENHLPDIIQKTTADLSRTLLADLKGKWSAESRRQRRNITGFRRRLYDRWTAPLESLRMLLTISRELGDTVNQDLKNSPEPGREHLTDVLLRLHARACQITDEILCLLEGGFADGAMARWRSLHEVAVVATFISEQGEDLAERYVLHEAMESKRAIEDYRACQPRLGYEPLEETDIKDVLDTYNQLIARFGREFRGDYGWASHHLGNAQPTFKDIERAVGIDYLRAHYRMASHNVHANPKGVFFKLGLIQEAQVLLAGPSNAGLADPGHGAALSLTQVSTTLNLLQPSFDNNVGLQIIIQLSHEIGEAFAQAHAQLIEDSGE